MKHFLFLLLAVFMTVESGAVLVTKYRFTDSFPLRIEKGKWTGTELHTRPNTRTVAFSVTPLLIGGRVSGAAGSCTIVLKNSAGATAARATSSSGEFVSIELTPLAAGNLTVDNSITNEAIVIDASEDDFIDGSSTITVTCSGASLTGSLIFESVFDTGSALFPYFVSFVGNGRWEMVIQIEVCDTTGTGSEACVL